MRKLRLLCLCMAIIIMISGVSGCMFNKDFSEIECNAESMIRHMEKKYNDEFEYVNSFGGSYGNSKDKNIIITSKKYPGNRISVCYRENDGEVYVTENYTQYRFKKETEEYIASMINELFGEDVILTYNVSVNGTKNNFTDQTDFEEFISSKEANINFKVVVSNSFSTDDMETVAKNVRQAVEATPLRAGAEIYFADSDENYKRHDELGYFEMKELHRIYFNKNNKNGVLEYEWR